MGKSLEYLNTVLRERKVQTNVWGSMMKNYFNVMLYNSNNKQIASFANNQVICADGKIIANYNNNELELD